MSETKKRTAKSADAVILDVLGCEFDSHEPTEAERKIRRRLRYYGHPYRQERVDLLRRFRYELGDEINRCAQSRYYAGRYDKHYSTMKDFNVEYMTRDFAKSYPEVPQEVVKEFVAFAIYLYYLR